MSLSLREKYAARVDELLSLEVELDGGRRPDPAPVIGRVLEAAGDLLRRRSAVKSDDAVLLRVLQKIPEPQLFSWADGLNVPELRSTLLTAASHAVEAALPDSDEDGERMKNWAMQSLFARDRVESALVALEALGGRGRGDAKVLAARLRTAVTQVDQACRTTVTSLTALNPARRPEAGFLDEAQRGGAWWFCERCGIDDDLLIEVLGGEKKGLLRAPEKRASDVVMMKRARRVTSDDLLRYDLGLASPAEQEAIRRQAELDPELKLALAAMIEGDRAIDGDPDLPPVHGAPIPFPSDRVGVSGGGEAPTVVEDNADFKVLVFRNPKAVQVVVQPRHADRLAAAAVFRGTDESRSVPSKQGAYGLEFDLGALDRVLNTSARVVVKLADGQSKSIEVRF